MRESIHPGPVGFCWPARFSLAGANSAQAQTPAREPAQQPVRPQSRWLHPDHRCQGASGRVVDDQSGSRLQPHLRQGQRRNAGPARWAVANHPAPAPALHVFRQQRRAQSRHRPGPALGRLHVPRRRRRRFEDQVQHRRVGLRICLPERRRPTKSPAAWACTTRSSRCSFPARPPSPTPTALSRRQRSPARTPPLPCRCRSSASAARGRSRRTGCSKASGQLFKADINGYDGRVTDLRADVTWMFNKNFGAGLGYNRFWTTVETTKNNFNGTHPLRLLRRAAVRDRHVLSNAPAGDRQCGRLRSVERSGDDVRAARFVPSPRCNGLTRECRSTVRNWPHQ